mgnify:CR=1 FL=1
MSIIYQQPKLHGIADIKFFILKNDIVSATEGIIALSMYGENRIEIFNFLKNILFLCDNENIKSACVKSMSHIVRIDKYIDDELLKILDILNANEYYQGSISDLMNDIEIFCKNYKT